MNQLVQLTPVIVKTFIQQLYSPIFWIVVFLVAFQYRKMNKTKELLFGINTEPLWQTVVWSAGQGALGGFVGSALMIFMGLSLTDIGIIYLLPLAIALMLISPRFLCFSYAGGLISVSYLLFGFPQVDVPQLMALVALLHMVEAVLILVSGHLGAMPVYTTNKQGQVIGAFNLQKFWPIPIVALAAVVLPDPDVVGEAMKMPDWWPIIKPGIDVDTKNLVYFILPVVAVLGYSDLAMVNRPRDKAKRSALHLFGFSVVLLALSVLASYLPDTVILAALFSPLGHEVVIWLGQRGELTGKPLYVMPERGLRVLEAVRDTPAAKLGLASGDIILTVNGVEVNSRRDLAISLGLHLGWVEAEWLEYPTNRFKRNQIRKSLEQDFGVILAPEPYDPPMVEFGSAGILARWWRRKR